jgi:hypothetical protein
MREAQAAQYAPPEGSELQRSLATVLTVRPSLDESALDRPTHQLDSAVVMDQQALRDRADVRLLPWRQRVQEEQELMLLGLDASGANGGLAEGEKPPDLVPQLGERSVLVGIEVGRFGHECRIYIMTRYIASGEVATRCRFFAWRWLDNDWIGHDPVP